MKYRGAGREVASKSEVVIERETARTWAARAVACYRNHARTRDTRWLLRANHYRDEALEHAAMVGDGGVFVGQVQQAIDRERRKKARRRAR